MCNPEGDLPIDVLEGLHALVDQSLLRVVDGGAGEPRFRRLETIREYARERLEASDEATVVREQHAAYYLALAETAAHDLEQGSAQVSWLERLEVEHDNRRAALQ